MQLEHHPDPRILGVRGFVIDRVNTVGTAWSKRAILLHEDLEHCLTVSAILHHNSMLQDPRSSLHASVIKIQFRRLRLALMNAQQRFLAYIFNETPGAIMQNWDHLANKCTGYPAHLIGDLAFKNTMTVGLYPYINGEFAYDVLKVLGECESTFQDRKSVV